MARVLIGTDGSDLAQHAAERARAVLDLDEVIVVSVIRGSLAALPVTGGPLVAGGPAEYEETLKALRAEAHVYAREIADKFGSVATTRVVEGDPGTELCRLALEEDVDVLVVGSHGAGFLRRVLLGSVSSFVANHAPCPVLIVRASDPAAD